MKTYFSPPNRWSNLLSPLFSLIALTTCLPKLEAAEPHWVWARVVGGGDRVLGPDVALPFDGNPVVSARIVAGRFASKAVNSAIGFAQFDSRGTLLDSILTPAAPYGCGSDLSLETAPNGEIVFSTTLSVTAGVPSWKLVYGKWAPNSNLSLPTSDVHGTLDYGTYDYPCGLWGVGVVRSAPDGEGGYFLIAEASFLSISGVSYNAVAQDDVFLMRVNSGGGLRWLKKWSGTQVDGLGSVAFDASDGSVILGGSSTSPIIALGTTLLDGGNDVVGTFVAKHNAEGIVLWVKRLDWQMSYLTSCTSLPDGSIGLIGGLWDGNRVVNRIGRLSREGDLLWDQSIPGGGPSYPPEVKADAGGNLYVLSTFNGSFTANNRTYTSKGGFDIAVSKFSPQGQLIWVKTGGFAFDDVGGGLWVGSGGQIYVTGTFQTTSTFDEEVVENSSTASVFLAKLVDTVGALPVILRSPESQLAPYGSEVRLSVEVGTGSPVTYQWLFGNTRIPGATNAAFILPSLHPSQEGSYSVEVSNDAGTVRSSAATILVRGQVPVRVTTFSGTNLAGWNDAGSGDQVRYRQPNGLALMPGGFIVVADAINHRIRLLNSSGAAATLAGQDASGFSDGPGSAAQFNTPLGVTTDPAGNVWVADTDRVGSDPLGSEPP